jgi:hypothetical protein
LIAIVQPVDVVAAFVERPDALVSA